VASALVLLAPSGSSTGQADPTERDGGSVAPTTKVQREIDAWQCKQHGGWQINATEVSDRPQPAVYQFRDGTAVNAALDQLLATQHNLAHRDQRSETGIIRAAHSKHGNGRRAVSSGP
jgi:hypothetical protein